MPVNGIQYEVKKGDTISSIAKKYSADVDEILNYNIVSLDDIQVGQKLIIPGATIVSEPSKVVAKGSSSSKKVAGYVVPLKGRITQGPHGRRSGIDIAAPIGTPIYSACTGKVLIAKQNGAWNGGSGNYAVINCSSGGQTLYAHMTKVTAVAGAGVESGEMIGTVGSTGNSTGPHLHFEGAPWLYGY